MKKLLLIGLFLLDIFQSIGFRCWNMGFRRHFHKSIKNHARKAPDPDELFPDNLPYDPDADLFNGPETNYQKLQRQSPFVNPKDVFNPEEDPDFSNVTITPPELTPEADDFWKSVLRYAKGEERQPVTQVTFGYNIDTGQFEKIPPPIRIPVNWSEVRYDLPTMLKKWTELQEENKVPKDMPLDLDLMLPHITPGDNGTLMFIPDLPEINETEHKSYHTEQELKGLWLLKFPNRDESEFTIEEALLAVADDPGPENEAFLREDDYLPKSAHFHLFKEIPPSHRKLFEEKSVKIEEEDAEEEPIVFTEQELERIWESQAEIQWGKDHGREFSVENALLLIDAVRNSEAWDYGDHEYFEAALLPEINDPDDFTGHPKFNKEDGPINQELVEYWKNSPDPRYLPPEDYFTNPEDDESENYDLPIDDPDDEWGPQAISKADDDPYDEEFYSILKELAEDLDTFEEKSIPIERDHEINEGDILNQFYLDGFPVGDSLHEYDDHLSKSITDLDWAGYNFPEKDAFPDMEKFQESWKYALPGSKIRNFSAEEPKRVWEIFNFPIGPKYDPHHFDDQEDLENEKLEEEIELTEEYYARKNINISELHPASTIRLYKEYPGLFPFTKRNQTDPVHIPEFKWDNFLKDEEYADIESYPNFVDYDRDEENWYRRISEDLKKYGEIRIPSMIDMNNKVNFTIGFDPKYLRQEMFANPFRDTDDPIYKERFPNMKITPVKNIKIPRCWLTRPRYHNYQSIDDYNKLIIYEDIGTDDDVYEVMSLELLFDLMNLYSEDVIEESRLIDQRDAVQAFLRAKNNNPDATFPVYEEVPAQFTPDKDRGVKYSSEIFESNAQYLLIPKRKSFEELYPNANWEQTKTIPYEGGPGSVIESYDWEPRQDLLPYLIEPEKVEIIRPIIRYLNFEAKLLSTKNDIFVFEYFGLMKNIIPIRNGVLEMTKDFYPQVKDVRLETIRAFDQFDIMDFDWVNPREYRHLKNMPDDLTF